MGRKNKVESSPSFIRCVLEKDVMGSKFWRLVSSSSKMAGSEGGDSRRCCTRVYQFMAWGKPTDVMVKFYYDYRSKYAKMEFGPLAESVLRHDHQGDLDMDIIIKKIGE